MITKLGWYVTLYTVDSSDTIDAIDSIHHFHPETCKRHAINSSLHVLIMFLQVEHPCLLHCFPQLEQAAAGKLVTVFLDYDGTLTPIVNNPDYAFMSDITRDIVRQVATLFPTAIISGRGRDKVEKFVQLKELYYAGSHGMDIVGPRVDGSSNGGSLPLHDGNVNNNNTPTTYNGNTNHLLAFQPAAQYEPLMQQIGDELSKAVNNIPGASVEDNKFCISVHFRNCDVNAYADVVQAVETVAGKYSDLKITRGRKVLEVRPKLEWDKGSALLHLLTMLGLSTAEVYCLYIGDDRTDEDAFKVLKESNIGAGILVSSRRKPTMGRWTLKDPTEVAAFLHQLVAWGRTGIISCYVDLFVHC